MNPQDATIDATTSELADLLAHTLPYAHVDADSPDGAITIHINHPAFPRTVTLWDGLRVLTFRREHGGWVESLTGLPLPGTPAHYLNDAPMAAFPTDGVDGRRLGLLAAAARAGHIPLAFEE